MSSIISEKRNVVPALQLNAYQLISLAFAFCFIHGRRSIVTRGWGIAWEWV